MKSVTSQRSRRALERLLAQGGWEIRRLVLEIDSVRSQVNVECFRDDGLWVRAVKHPSGHGRLDRFQRTECLGQLHETAAGWPQSRQIRDMFLGRQYTSGARNLMRVLTQYLVDNASHPVSLASMRAAWAPLMQPRISHEESDEPF
ncbi:hypothetical protein BJI67_16380 (plasmid) [Acidihalobacter aeolianus]|uniref:Uncharacterized protein n=2 Tax=Acidihalobacter aeolianus TaxID=2792603 RepID=A0A1D8KCX8_9GAMM|nr:hypothetical protein BJI67_16380 [Acidihalobacter aeolianus]